MRLQFFLEISGQEQRFLTQNYGLAEQEDREKLSEFQNFMEKKFSSG